MKRFNYDYKIGDKFMMRNKAAYKYETLYRVPYEKNQTWTNEMVALQIVATKINLLPVHLSPIEIK